MQSIVKAQLIIILPQYGGKELHLLCPTEHPSLKYQEAGSLSESSVFSHYHQSLPYCFMQSTKEADCRAQMHNRQAAATGQLELNMGENERWWLQQQQDFTPTKSPLHTYLEGSLVIHGTVGVGKSTSEDTLIPPFQDGWDTKPLERELQQKQSHRLRVEALVAHSFHGTLESRYHSPQLCP